MVLNIILLIIGFILLVKVADFFVDGASSTAKNLKISKVFIGLTIMAFGTSAPEFAISIQSLSKGSTDMLLGNVIGSNVLNILLILGVAAITHPIKIKENTVKKELPLCLLISTALVVLFLDKELNSSSINQITRSDAIIILLFFAIFLYYLISLARQKKHTNEEKPPYKIGKSLILILIGLVGIIIGSDFVVDNASNIAMKLGLSERIIAITIVSIGTSLPELVTTIVSSKKGEQDLLIGNIIGSNIFNSCIALAIPVALFGTITPSGFNYIDLVVLIFSSILLFLFAKTRRTITRFEGFCMFTIFIVYYVLIFVLK